MALVAGIDCSTQSTKALVVDAGTGRVVAQGSCPNEVRGEGGARESDPRAWASAMASALEATGLAGRLAAVSVAGQQHGLVALDEGGEPVSAAPLWNDTRASGDARAVVRALGGPGPCATKTGSVLTGSFTVAHWARWKRERPELAAQAAAVLLPHDYLTARLTGRYVTDRSDVSGTGWWAPGDESYSTEVLGLAEVGLPESMLPEVVAADAAAGAVTSEAAETFGLPAGIPVGCGAGDNAAAALALALEPGEAAISLGTSGTVFAPALAPSADPSGTVAGFAGADGRWLPLACTLNATLAVDEVASWLGLGREEVRPSGSVVFLPWFGGERTPDLPAATGAMAGLRYGTAPGSVLQAAYEGLVATLLAALERLAEWAPQSPDKPLVVIGGGARGSAWQETVGRLSGRPLVVPTAGELVAYGAAVQAAAVLDGSHPSKVASAWEGRRGDALAPLERDTAKLEQIAAWRQHLQAWYER